MEVRVCRDSFGARDCAFLSRKTATAAPTQATATKAVAPKAASGAASAMAIPDTTIAVNSPRRCRSDVVRYEINASRDAGKHTIDATEVLTYHNLTGQALDHFPFHLYQNAFEPKATFVRDSKLERAAATPVTTSGSRKSTDQEDIKSIEVVGQEDMTSHLHYIAPDDGNKDDRTVVDLPLAKPIPPMLTCNSRCGEFHQRNRRCRTAGARWKARFPVRRPWFPKVGVSWHRRRRIAIECRATTVFADFGVYDVKVTVPADKVFARAINGVYVLFLGSSTCC